MPLSKQGRKGTPKGTKKGMKGMKGGMLTRQSHRKGKK